MRITSPLVVAVTTVVLALSLAACSSGGDDSTSAPMDDTATQAPPPESSDQMMATQRTGSFEGLNDKNVAGEITIDGDTAMITGFSSDEGPDLHLYLTNGTDEAAVAAGTEIGEVAFDEAEQTFALGGIDVADFTDLVVHCDKAKAVFGAAALS